MSVERDGGDEQDERGEARARLAAERRRPEREPDGDEAVGGGEDDQPGAEVERREERERQRAAGQVGRVQPLAPGRQTHPRLGAARVQHQGVGGGQQQQVEVDRLVAHAWTRQHQCRHRVTCNRRAR